MDEQGALQAAAHAENLRRFRLNVAIPFYLVNLSCMASAIALWIIFSDCYYCRSCDYGDCFQSYRTPALILSVCLVVPVIGSQCMKNGAWLTLSAAYLPTFLKSVDPVVAVFLAPIAFCILLALDIAAMPFLIPVFLIKTSDEAFKGSLDVRIEQQIALGNVTLSKPMLVMDKRTLLALAPKSTFAEMSEHLFSPVTGGKIVFLSHKWDAPGIWDKDGKILALMQADAHKDPDDCCYWIDYFCIPPMDDWEVKVVWIRNIPNFLNVCTDVRYYSTGVNPMLASAWCLYEILSDKASGKQKLGRVQVTVQTPSGSEKVTPRLRMVRAQTLRELREILQLCKIRLAARGYLESEIVNWMKSCEEMQPKGEA